MAAAGAATGDRVVILNELAAEASEDGRAAGEARAVLLADAGRRTPDLRRHRFSRMNLTD